MNEKGLNEEAWQLAFEHCFCFPGIQSEIEFDSKQEGFYFGYLQAKENLYTIEDVLVAANLAKNFNKTGAEIIECLKQHKNE